MTRFVFRIKAGKFTGYNQDWYNHRYPDNRWYYLHVQIGQRHSGLHNRKRAGLFINKRFKLPIKWELNIKEYS